MLTAWKQALANAAPVIALLAGIVLVHASTLSGAARLTAHHDNLDGAAPLRVEAARQWKSGQLPLWNPYKRTGMPLVADTTAGAIYPGNVPFLFVEAPRGAGADSAVFRAMDQVALLHALLAGVFLFAFLRATGTSAAASVLGGLVYACSGTMTWFAAWYIQIQNSVAWLPLILLAVHQAATVALSPGWIALGGATVALQFFAGFPETSFYSAILAAGYALSLVRRDRVSRPLVAVTCIYVAGLLLAAVQLVPALELQALSRRPAALTLEVFQSLPASAWMIRDWLLPTAAAGLEFPPAAAYHFGAAAVVAALLGLTGFSRRAVFFAVVLVVGFVLSIGAATPVSAGLHHLPGFSAFRHPFKHLFEVSFAMAGLAALGADRLLRWRGGARWPLVVVAAGILATCVSLRQSQAVLVAANPASVDTSGTTPAIVGAIEPGWRVLTPRHYFLKRDPAFLLGDYPSQFEVAAVHGAGPFLWKPLADATGMVEEETTYRRGLFDAADRTLALLSCRYLVQTPRGGKLAPALDPSVWRTAGESGEARLMERSDALPRVRFTGAVRCSDPETIATTLRGGAADPRDVALIDCSDGERPRDAYLAPASLAARVVSERPGSLVIETQVPAGGHAFLVVAQPDYPGWEAHVDGRTVPIRRVHGLVQGVEVPGGSRSVELTYAPLSLRAGAAISAATAILLLVGLIAKARHRRRRDSGRGALA